MAPKRRAFGDVASNQDTKKSKKDSDDEAEASGRLKTIFFFGPAPPPQASSSSKKPIPKDNKSKSKSKKTTKGKGKDDQDNDEASLAQFLTPIGGKVEDEEDVQFLKPFVNGGGDDDYGYNNYDEDDEESSESSEDEEDSKAKSKKKSKKDAKSNKKSKKSIRKPDPSEFIKLTDSKLLSQELDEADGFPFQRSRWELKMHSICSAILVKPNWQEKVNNKTIVNKWVAELEKAEEDEFKGSYRRENEIVRITPDMVSFVMSKLQFLATLNDGPIEVSTVPGVWQADDLIPEKLLAALKKGVSKLENVPDVKKDWHPGSNGQVLDLVHPSLFCWVNGTTPLYHRANKSCHAYQVDIQKLDDYTRSTMYQWLPAEFYVNDKGEAKIMSYINNLHPDTHKPLYNAIEKVFEKFVPLFSRVLGDLIDISRGRTGVKGPSWSNYVYELESWYKEKFEIENEEEEDEEEEEEAPKKKGTKKKPVPKKKPKKVPKKPAPPTPKFSPYKPTLFDMNGRQLQVIVKLANIELTPQKPKYDGGSWHVEGMRNEDIVSSGIYYYESSNISKSVLNFRQATNINYGDYDETGALHNAISDVFGVDNGDQQNHNLGGLVTQEGRCIAFPNLYQHCVAPFELKNKKKNGYRKILVFFLVDPTHRILSTADVPPQQKSWAAKELSILFRSLPRNIIEHICSYLPMMSLSEAKAHREELMNERKQFVRKNTQVVFERTFNLCEH